MCTMIASDGVSKLPRLPNDGEHTECHPDEYFIGNFAARSVSDLPWETVRMGVIAYKTLSDKKEKTQVADGFVPVFIKIAEYEEHWAGFVPPEATQSDDIKGTSYLNAYIDEMKAQIADSK